jgi:polar amino acid transport system substrate-binding protein
MLVGKGGRVLTLADMVGKMVGVGSGTTYLEQVRKLKGLKSVVVLQNGMHGAERLKEGSIDVWVEDVFAAMEFMKKNPDYQLTMGDRIFDEVISMAVRPKDKEFLKRWNEGLSLVMKDGTYRRLSEKYFGHDVRCK